MTQLFPILFIFMCSSLVTYAQRFVPPEGDVLLIIGQDLGAIGGFNMPNNKGYNDFFDISPAGYTSYTSISNLEGLTTNANYGSGDMFANKILNTHSDKVLCLGLYLVGSLSSITSGDYDSKIISLCKWIKSTEVPIFLRIGYEFNGAHNNYNKLKYKLAFRYIVDMMNHKGVTNVSYVWQSDGMGSAATLLQWYPGDEYVDWMGYSHFHNKGEGILTLAKEKNMPVMIAEATPQGKDLSTGDGDEIWNSWFAPLFQQITHNSQIKALCYINTDWDSQSMWYGLNWGDTRIQNNTTVTNKWLAEISKEKWIMGDDNVFELLNFSPSKLDETIIEMDYSISIHNNILRIVNDSNQSINITLYDLKGIRISTFHTDTNVNYTLSHQLPSFVLAVVVDGQGKKTTHKIVIAK